MQIYLVGGAVRDRLLELPVKERDWVVIGATPEEMLALGYRQVGKDFPVFLHPDTHEEYALARTERKTGPGYKGFSFHTSPDISLIDDLKRRDLTINAIAESAGGELIDPYNGEEDLRNGVLRHVSSAFSEDPVRILRIARFAARFAHFGFTVSHDTNRLMRDMVSSGEADHLVAERVWAELEKALATSTPSRFFKVLRGCGALLTLFPEINASYAIKEKGSHDSPTSTAVTLLQQSAEKTDDICIRFALLLWALQPGKETQNRVQSVTNLCKRVKAPSKFTALAKQAIEQEVAMKGDDAEKLLQAMQSSGALKEGGCWDQLLNLYLIANIINSHQFALYIKICDQIKKVNSKDFIDQGIEGAALGKAIHAKRVQRIDELL